MESIEFIFLTVVMVSVFATMIFFVLFGQISVRKLRKDPETKNALGIEFASGLDIINVAQALALPKALTRRLKSGSLSALYADADLLHKHTNTFDRALGAVFYWMLMFSGLSGGLLVLLDAFGVFD